MEQFKTLAEKEQYEADLKLFSNWKNGVFSATNQEGLEKEVSQVIAAFGRLRHTVTSLGEGYNEITTALTRNTQKLNSKEA